MKSKHLHFPACIALGLVMPAAADVIYSNLQNLSIPANFDGLYLDVNTGNSNTNMASPVAGWDINPFYGGKFMQNSPAFQPVRATTGNTSAIVNLAGGTSVGSGSTYSTFTWDNDNNSATPQVPGYGSSQTLTTSGGNFTDGQEGYLGFKLYTDATYTVANYGWMRVVFTNNTGGAVIKDWAYDTSGAAINTGNVLQSAAANNAQTVTLTTVSGSFTLGSTISNTGGNANSVVKTGAGTTTLTGSNTYTGATIIQQGSLALSSTGSIANSTTLVVGDTGSSGAVLDLTAKSGYTIASGTTLKGVGTVNVGANNTLTISGTHAPGNSPGVQSVTGNLSYGSGSIFEWDLASSATGTRGTQYDGVNVTGILGGGGAIFKVVLDSGSYAEDFWKTNQEWTGIFTASNAVNMAGIFSDIQWSGGSLLTTPLTTPPGHFSFTNSGTTLTWTAVPEPTSALAGLLLGAGLLRRSRKPVGTSGPACPKLP